MWAIGVKTAATCDTIDGLSVKESPPPLQEGSDTLPSWPSPASSESRPDVGVGRTGPIEELEGWPHPADPCDARRPAAPGILPQRSHLWRRVPRALGSS